MSRPWSDMTHEDNVAWRAYTMRVYFCWLKTHHKRHGFTPCRCVKRGGR